MGKKIVLIVFGSIALAGLVIAIVGFALGGLPASITVSNGQLVYYNYRTTVPIGPAPGWMAHWEEDDTSDDIGASYPRNPGGGEQTPAGNHTKIDIDISAGYLVIKPGDEAKLEVDGPLEYSTYEEDGTWKIRSKIQGVRSFWDENWGRYLFRLGDDDITTTFTLTVPDSVRELDVELGMGEANIRGINLRELDCTTDMGHIIVDDVAADDASFEVNMGGIDVTNFSGVDCDLDVDMGAIELTGSLSGKLEANCSMGGITATLPRPADYGWKAEVSLGAITIDGHARGGLHSSSQGGNESQRPYFDLKCGMGSIEILFR